jgi:TonB-dependent receptor
MGTNLIRAMLLASASAAAAVAVAPVAAHAQEATYQIDIPAQSMGDALRALGKATKQNIVFSGSVVKGKRSAAVRGRMSASEALSKMMAGSGLKMSRGSGGGFVVIAGNVEAAPDRTEVPATIPQATVATNASTVVDARTGAALKGALVEIVETGEKASTNDLGEFRFAGKNASVNLRISYLGYPQYEQYVELRNGRATTGILLSDGSATSEIVVTAYQSARAQALNQERTADNVSTVISSDLLGEFEGTTISEALRRAPGISFKRNDLTNEGTNITVRGLNEQFNTVTLNGLRLPVGDGVSRSPNLGNVLADSVSQVVINKTLLPSQDGSGTGGLIEIQTKGPLDRPRRFASLSVEGSTKGRGFNDEYVASGTISARFGAEENFGLSASVQYRSGDSSRITGTTVPTFGEYLPATDQGRPVVSSADISVLRAFPFEEGVDDVLPTFSAISIGDQKIKNLVLNLEAQWKIAEHTNLRLTFTSLKSDVDQVSRAATFSANSGYAPLPIEELGGEVRSAYVWQDPFSGAERTGFVSQGLGGYKTKEISKVLSFEGYTNVGPLSFQYRGGYTSGRGSTITSSATFGKGVSFALSDLEPVVSARTVAGRIVSPFQVQNNYPLAQPALSPSGFALINENSNYTFFGGSGSNFGGENRRISTSLDAKYDFENFPINYVQFGGFWERSSSRSLTENTSYTPVSYDLPPSALGLIFNQPALSRLGETGGFLIPSVTSTQALLNGFDNYTNGSSPVVIRSDFLRNPLADQERLREDDFALFVQSKIVFGKLEVVGGVRYERVNTLSNSVVYPTIYDENDIFDAAYSAANTKIDSLSGKDSRFLPRITVNFRLNNYVIFRAGYYSSIARPSLNQLGGSAQFELSQREGFGPAGNQPSLRIGLPNPNLKAASTHNLDASFEYYDKDIGAIKIGAFFKPTKNAFFASQATTTSALDGIILPEDPRFQNLPSNIYVVVSRPENDKTIAKLWGVEVSLEKRLNFLPGGLSGLGIFGNYTYTRSSRVVKLFDIPSLSFVDYDFRYGGQPSHSGTVGITYERQRFDAGISYNFQTWSATGINQALVRQIQRPISSLDARVSYEFDLSGATVKVFAEGSDLLKGPKDFSNGDGYRFDNGRMVTTTGSYFGGRALRLGMVSRF